MEREGKRTTSKDRPKRTRSKPYTRLAGNKQLYTPVPLEQTETTKWLRERLHLGSEFWPPGFEHIVQQGQVDGMRKQLPNGDPGIWLLRLLPPEEAVASLASLNETTYLTIALQGEEELKKTRRYNTWMMIFHYYARKIGGVFRKR